MAFITYILQKSMKKYNASLSDFIRERWGFIRHVRELFKIHKYADEAKYFDKQLEFLLNSQDYPIKLSEAEYDFAFNPDKYPVSDPIENNFKKHYFPQVASMNADEIECARFIDSLSEVKYWIRNIEKKEDASFWLPTAKTRFYPDFMCLLNDGRIFAIEYKGEHLYSNDDSKAKRIIGNLWAERSNGKCLFLMARKDSFKAEITKMISGK